MLKLIFDEQLYLGLERSTLLFIRYNNLGIFRILVDIPYAMINCYFPDVLCMIPWV
jgi:hypothetical protein